MKKLSLIIAMTIICKMALAQLTLLHTFNNYMGNTFASINYYGDNKYYPIYLSIENGTVRSYIYNADFSLDDLFSITPNIPEGYTLYSSSCKFLSNHLINNDDDYEWLIVAYNSSADVNSQYYTYITNSHGYIILDLGYSRASPLFLDFHVANGQLRMSLLRYYQIMDDNGYYTNYYTDIYACGGNVTNVNQNKKEVSMSAYPNPATSFINLPYELNEGETSTMNIYDINGRLIEQKPIGYHFNKVVLETSDYKAGTYIYEYNGKSNRFIVQ